MMFRRKKKKLIVKVKRLGTLDTFEDVPTKVKYNIDLDNDGGLDA